MDEHSLLITVLICIILMLGISLLVIWFFSKGQKKILKARMLQKEQELNFQKELLENSISIQEAERNRIALELHDDITSQLNIIHLHIHILKKEMQKAAEENSVVKQIEKALSSSIERSRRMAHELVPPLLQKFGIAYVLKELESSINQSESLQMQITSAHLIHIEDKNHQLHLYRIVQELVNNTLKYAQAKNINLLFKNEVNSWSMTYTDDGIGFESASIRKGSGFKNIQSRCQLLNGSYEISTWHQAAGFQIKFTFFKDANN